MRNILLLLFLSLLPAASLFLSGCDEGESTFASDNTAAVCSASPPDDYDFEVGQSYWGANNWIEYIPGALPIIITAPHGGSLTPDEIPVFNDGSSTDAKSQEYTRAVADELEVLTGKKPHVVINHIMRNRLNLNRAKESDNFDNPFAMQAWDEFHAFVNNAKEWVTSACGKGLYLDFHTNGFDHGMNVLGYLLYRSDLNQSDEVIDAMVDETSLKNLAADPEVTLSELVHGPFSLGEIMNSVYELSTIPNAVDIPFDYGYFNGGYNTAAHGSRDGGVIDGIQLESHWSFVNQGESTRLDYSGKLARAIADFVERWYGFNLSP